jgi:hypothetical protein
MDTLTCENELLDLRDEAAGIRVMMLSAPLGTLEYEQLERSHEEIIGRLAELGPEVGPCLCGDENRVWPGEDITRRHYLRCHACGRTSKRHATPDLAAIAWNEGEVE